MDHDYNVEYSQTWSGGLQYELLPVDDGRGVVHGHVDARRRQRARPQRARAGPGPIQARRPIPQLSRINAIRFDGKSIYHGAHVQGRAAAAQQLRVQRQLHALDVEGRCVEPGRDRVGSERAAERAEHLRRDRRVGALELRSSASVRRQRRLRAAVLRRTPAASPKRVLGGWRVNAIFTAQSGAPFTVNLGVDRANIGAGPAQRPDQLRDPNLPGGERTPERWFDTVGVRAAGAVHLRQRARATASSAPASPTSISAVAKTWALRGRRAARVPLGGLQPAQPRELRPAEPNLRQRRTSAASSARRTRARCSSGCGSRSERSRLAGG